MLVFLYRLYRCRGGHLWIWSQHVNNAFSVGLILKICAHKFRDSPTHLMLTLQTRLISATFGIMFFFCLSSITFASNANKIHSFFLLFDKSLFVGIVLYYLVLGSKFISFCEGGNCVVFIKYTFYTYIHTHEQKSFHRGNHCFFVLKI